MEIFCDPPKWFDVDRSSPLASEIKSIIYDYIRQIFPDIPHDVFAEYVTVLICNRKTQYQARKCVDAFLGEMSEKFLSWLWDLLLKYDQLSAVDPGSEIKDENSTYPRSSGASKDGGTKRARNFTWQSSGYGNAQVESLYQSHKGSSKCDTLEEHEGYFSASSKDFKKVVPVSQAHVNNNIRSFSREISLARLLSDIPQQQKQLAKFSRGGSCPAKIGSLYSDSKVRRSVWDRLGKPGIDSSTGRKRNFGEVNTGLHAAFVRDRSAGKAWDKASEVHKRSAFGLQQVDFKGSLQVKHLETGNDAQKTSGTIYARTLAGRLETTEEDIKSRTLLVTNVPFQATKEALYWHFGSSGAVINVGFLPEDSSFGSQKYRSAYVTFVSNESAAITVGFSRSSFASRLPKAEMPIFPDSSSSGSSSREAILLPQPHFTKTDLVPEECPLQHPSSSRLLSSLGSSSSSNQSVSSIFPDAEENKGAVLLSTQRRPLFLSVSNPSEDPDIEQVNPEEGTNLVP